MFPRAAVSLYPVNKFGSGRLFAAFLTADCLLLTDFSVNRKTVAKKQKAGMKAGLPQFAVASAQ
jgi:hypothetical protein